MQEHFLHSYFVHEYFNGEMRQVTDTPTVLDCAMNFVEAADETLKRIAWPGYICFTWEKQHYELPSQFSIKYEDLLSVPHESTTFLNKEDIKRLNDWRNEFERGVRQQSVRISFTKDKAGTLPFYMYTSADANDSTEEQALTSIQELFNEADTSMHPPENSYRSDVEPVPLPGHDHKTYQSSYTVIYAIKCKSNFFSILISRTIDANDFFGTKYVIIDKSSFLFETSSEEAKCKKSDVICEIGKDSIRLFNGRLELSEERLCQILSDCRGECDLETNETEENQECYLDSEEEEALTKIWGRKRSGRLPRRMDDFF